jgi:hypothetical protein
MTLGQPQTALADGIFDPFSDQVRLKDGSVKSNYFRDTLKVPFYRPLDKSRFPLPPSGWCTWYYYYNRINADEVKRNTDWIAANLKDFGAQYVQIDDGWQGLGGRDGGRDWSHVNPDRFPQGMAELAAYIKSAGLKPGLWLAPHGQSNPTVVRDNPCWRPTAKPPLIPGKADFCLTRRRPRLTAISATFSNASPAGDTIISRSTDNRSSWTSIEPGNSS